MSNSLTQTLNAVPIDGWQISGPKVLWTKFAIRNQISEILGSGPLERDAVPTIRFLPKCSKITIKTNQHQLGLDIQSICPGCVPWLWSGHSEAKLGGERSENGAGYYPLDTIHSIATHKFLVPHSVNRPTVVIEE